MFIEDKLRWGREIWAIIQSEIREIERNKMGTDMTVFRSHGPGSIKLSERIYSFQKNTYPIDSAGS